MRLLGRTFLENFPLQSHKPSPRLPGAFPGTNAIERAFEAFNQGRIANTGVMLHFVPDEGIDSGPVLSVVHVPINKGDTLSILEERIHSVEHRELINLARRLANNPRPKEIQSQEMQETRDQDKLGEKESGHAYRIDIGI